MRDFLSFNDIEELKLDHRAERESRFADRLKSILMLNSGLSYSKTAQYLLLDELQLSDPWRVDACACVAFERSR